MLCPYPYCEYEQIKRTSLSKGPLNLWNNLYGSDPFIGLENFFHWNTSHNPWAPFFHKTSFLMREMTSLLGHMLSPCQSHKLSSMSQFFSWMSAFICYHYSMKAFIPWKEPPWYGEIICFITSILFEIPYKISRSKPRNLILLLCVILELTIT